eukprot:CAMPEP_0168590710 /NCGR_PEP_ID=MMETSP0420-20121227/6717_1 /TAXON_ID=498008 /ORGANISM="Pessonella sp." /LENGTH=77 /DNA_ID=CAMNT_0008626395 /DNA_START=956 /DNA_END=1189 /DNA_ORIENTATION=-
MPNNGRKKQMTINKITTNGNKAIDRIAFCKEKAAAVIVNVVQSERTPTTANEPVAPVDNPLCFVLIGNAIDPNEEPY